MSRTPLKVAFQMDSMDSIKPKFDSTFLLMLEAQSRGYEIYHYLPAALVLENNILRTRANPITVRDTADDYYTFADPETLELTEFNIIFLRQNPPFNMAYITTTYLLEKIKDRALIVNDPTSVRDCSEKIFATEFADLMPPTLITADHEQIKNFIKTHKEVILKPLYSNAGSGIIKTHENDNNINSILNDYKALFNEPVLAQKFLPKIREGDKRILLFDGEPVETALLRIPTENSIIAAMALGATGQKTTLTDKDKEICERIKPELQKRGLIFVGIDVIDEHLTEINITSPTGLRYINELYNTSLEKDLWDCIEKKLNERKNKH